MISVLAVVFIDVNDIAAITAEITQKKKYLFHNNFIMLVKIFVNILVCFENFKFYLRILRILNKKRGDAMTNN